MKEILILGAGRSSSSLIKYLLEEGQKNQWRVTVGDMNLELAADKVEGFDNGKAIHFDIQNFTEKSKAISEADLVISLLPPPFHPEVADTCISEGKHMLSASYTSPQIEAMDHQAKKQGVLILKECGLDPGLDHMSAMKHIDQLKASGAQLQAFRSYTGGLLAPESEDNPWKYKFTWNPRNVVLAGKGVAKYIENGRYKMIPYHKLFHRRRSLEVEGYGKFEGYANRDSLKYRSIYNLEEIPTLIRGTLRREGYCRAWDVFVQLGMSEDTYPLINLSQMSWEDYTRTFLPESGGSVEQAFCDYLDLDPQSELFEKFKWLGLFDQQKIGMQEGTPADVLLHLLKQKWTLKPEDKDMIVMQHQFDYQLDGQQKRLTSSMVVIGDNSIHTAMSKTVGLPLGIAAKLILQKKIQLTGVRVPTEKQIYEPVLEELENKGITFKTTE